MSFTLGFQGPSPVFQFSLVRHPGHCHSGNSAFGTHLHPPPPPMHTHIYNGRISLFLPKGKVPLPHTMLFCLAVGDTVDPSTFTVVVDNLS